MQRALHGDDHLPLVVLSVSSLASLASLPPSLPDDSTPFLTHMWATLGALPACMASAPPKRLGK